MKKIILVVASLFAFSVFANEAMTTETTTTTTTGTTDTTMMNDTGAMNGSKDMKQAGTKSKMVKKVMSKKKAAAPKTTTTESMESTHTETHSN